MTSSRKVEPLLCGEPACRQIQTFRGVTRQAINFLRANVKHEEYDDEKGRGQASEDMLYGYICRYQDRDTFLL